ncbi:MAG: hypothetical protein ACXVUE_20355 [Solirubrobacteraceae bacterium]
MSEEPPSGDDVVALTGSPGFWVLCATPLGVALAFAALAYLGLIKGGTKLWFTLPKNPGWFDGSLWWVAVTAGAGVLVGVLRHAFAVLWLFLISRIVVASAFVNAASWRRRKPGRT